MPTTDPIIDVLIPARDEAKALPGLEQELASQPIRRVILVDNASVDGTAEVARACGFEVVGCPTPGYGNACLTGMDYARQDPPDILVFMDGDAADNPAYLVDLVTPIQIGRADFVIGSRALGQAEQGSLTSTQVFGNWLATRLIRFFWGVRYSDLGPFRAISWPSLMKLNMMDRNYGWTIEMQIKAIHADLRFEEVAVDYRTRIGHSKISGTLSGSFHAGRKILWTIFKQRFLR